VLSSAKVKFFQNMLAILHNSSLYFISTAGCSVVQESATEQPFWEPAIYRHNSPTQPKTAHATLCYDSFDQIGSEWKPVGVSADARWEARHHMRRFLCSP
jgi:hypothetical protein